MLILVSVILFRNRRYLAGFILESDKHGIVDLIVWLLWCTVFMIRLVENEHDEVITSFSGDRLDWEAWLCDYESELAEYHFLLATLESAG